MPKSPPVPSAAAAPQRALTLDQAAAYAALTRDAFIAAVERGDYPAPTLYDLNLLDTFMDRHSGLSTLPPQTDPTES